MQHTATDRLTKKRRAALWVLCTVLAVLVAFFVVTKGVLLINTETTYIDFGDTDMTLEEQAEAALELTKPKE